MPQVCFFSRALDHILFFYKTLMLNDSKVRIKETVCYDTLYYNDSVSSFFLNSHSKYNILTAYYLIEVQSKDK